jgi:hypothetical protein
MDCSGGIHPGEHFRDGQRDSDGDDVWRGSQDGKQERKRDWKGKSRWTIMTEEDKPVTDLASDAPVVMLKRALRNTLILGIIPASVLWIASGWRNAAMLATGALISAASIWEWLRLVRLINARLDHQKAPMGTPVVVLLFVLRLTIFAGAIYGSLKCFQGSAMALLCGLGLAVLTVGWEALRMLRD